jgi:hypothetical protein
VGFDQLVGRRGLPSLRHVGGRRRRPVGRKHPPGLDGGAGAATLSPSPAGIGAVEVTMVAFMAAVGIKGAHAITTVLVYRIMSLRGAGSPWAAAYEYLDRRKRHIADARPIAD